MKQKTVYVVGQGGNYNECPRIGTAAELRKARFNLSIAADELRERGSHADFQTVYNGVKDCYWSMPDGLTRITEFELFDALLYMETCKANKSEIYWPYVQALILDFLECEHLNSSNYNY